MSADAEAGTDGGAAPEGELSLRELFDRETVLDLLVNFVPLGIMLFFVGLFLLVNPFGWDTVYSSLQFGILVGSFVLLAVLTYLSGRVISRDEKRHVGEVDPGRTKVAGVRRSVENPPGTGGTPAAGDGDGASEASDREDPDGGDGDGGTGADAGEDDAPASGDDAGDDGESADEEADTADATT